ncbi:MAG TPA: hypothetical protein VMZ71_05170 [Gemmataceae bacterium]|nr:hypothetical protein [Gemmataceae bacterium]
MRKFEETIVPTPPDVSELFPTDELTDAELEAVAAGKGLADGSGAVGPRWQYPGWSYRSNGGWAHRGWGFY